MRLLLILLTLTGLVSFTFSAFALTADEILHLKKSGVSDKTIELMIQSEMEEKNRADSAIQITDTKTATIYSTGKPAPTAASQQEKLNVERAWEMLKNLSVEIKN